MRTTGHDTIISGGLVAERLECEGEREREEGAKRERMGATMNLLALASTCEQHTRHLFLAIAWVCEAISHHCHYNVVGDEISVAIWLASHCSLSSTEFSLMFSDFVSISHSSGQTPSFEAVFKPGVLRKNTGLLASGLAEFNVVPHKPKMR